MILCNRALTCLFCLILFGSAHLLPHLRSFPAAGEFRSSRYAQEPLLFASNLASWKDDLEFRVGMVAETSRGYTVRIERLEYERARYPDMPSLVACCSTFQAVDDLPASVERDLFPGHLEPDELVHLPDQLVRVPASEFQQATLINPPREGKCAAAARGSVCRFALTVNAAGDFVVAPYASRVVLFTFEALAAGQDFVWIEIFVDGFTSRTARSRSTTGVYFSISSMNHRDHCRKEGIHMLTLDPPGVGCYEVRPCCDLSHAKSAAVAFCARWCSAARNGTAAETDESVRHDPSRSAVRRSVACPRRSHAASAILSTSR
jgi:hypothetical protein